MSCDVAFASRATIPAQPIANPAEYAFELAEAAGPFYTQETPEDTKALSAHVLTPEEFLDQSELVMNERRRLLRFEWQRCRDNPGDRFLFFYLSSLDRRNHMLARQMDEDHPFHDQDTPPRQADAIRTIYREVDEMVGWAMAALDDDAALIVMSDHGFAPWRRSFNLNSWLREQGYLVLKDPGLAVDPGNGHAYFVEAAYANARVRRASIATLGYHTELVTGGAAFRGGRGCGAVGGDGVGGGISGLEQSAIPPQRGREP